MTQLKPYEVWRQDVKDQDLWHGSKGVMVNSAALEARQVFFEIIRVPSHFDPVQTPQQDVRA